MGIIIDAMESAPVKDTNVPLNQAIRLIHKEYTYHRNTPLSTCLYLTTHKYLALYASLVQEGSSEQLKNPETRVTEIRVAEHDRYCHFQLFRGGKVLLLCYQIPNSATARHLLESAEKAKLEEKCAFHTSNLSEDSMINKKLAYFCDHPLSCTGTGNCALHVLYRLLEN